MSAPQEYELQAHGDYHKKKIAEVYWEYEKQLRANNALDFDDLLLKTVQLFQTQPDVLEYYQERFRYILVDEYQDTNNVQFQLISILAKKYQNLCVVGDDDQSIYRFRGANIRNILDFEKVFHDTKVIKLEQNYRSTDSILQAANAVIRHNLGRKQKSLWTEKGDGEQIQYRRFENGYDEAAGVASAIAKRVRDGLRSYNDFAVLYRTNAQSRMFEEAFIALNIPYKVVGGVNFYSRKEIKDILAYLKTIDNGQDDLAVKRIINVPKRGIGLATIDRVQEYSIEHEISFYEALRVADLIPAVGRSLGKLESFMALMEHLKQQAQGMSISELTRLIIELTGYDKMLAEEEDEVEKARLENIEELINKMVLYEESCEDEPPTLSGFLEEVALVADIDSLDESSDYVVLMTLHSAKGLEFPEVFLVGMEDGLFPSYMAIVNDDPTELEEERRLCYVGITRAEEMLTMTSADRRMVRGEMQYNKVSRFVKEIPQEFFEGDKRNLRMTEEQPNYSGFMQAKQAFKAKAFAVPRQTQQFGMKDGGALDYEVTVEFDKVGVKKMFATFAKLQKID